MAYEPTSYELDGVETDFDVPFPYVAKAHVKARVGGSIVAFTWLTPARIALASPGASGAVLTLSRETDIETPAVTFQPTQTPFAVPLNAGLQQVLYSMQEEEAAAARSSQHAAAAALSKDAATASASAAHGSASAASGHASAAQASAASAAPVAAIVGDISAVAAIAGAVTTAAAQSANIAAVAGNAANIVTVAGIAADIQEVASYPGDLAALADAVETAIDGALIPADIGVSVQAHDADTAKTDVAQTWSAAQDFRRAISTGNVVQITNTDAGANGAFLKMHHHSASPAASDFVGGVQLHGNTDTTPDTFLGGVYLIFDAVAHASRTVHWEFWAASSGGMAKRGSLDASGWKDASGNLVLTTATGARLGVQNTFDSGGSVNTQSIVASSVPSLRLFKSGGASDAKDWRIESGTGDHLWFDTYSDAGSFVASPMMLTRAGLLTVATVHTNVPLSSETSGTLTVASANKEVRATGDITIPASVFAAPNKIRIYAGASSRTLTQGSGGTQRRAGSSGTGNFTLAARGWALVEFISATEWVVSGNVT